MLEEEEEEEEEEEDQRLMEKHSECNCIFYGLQNR
jgi:hypothetical protein